MNNTEKMVAVGVSAAVVVAVLMWAIDVDVTGDVEMPEVVADIDVQGGKLPDIDVETVDVDIKEKTATVDIPTDVDVNVKTEEKEIPYPTIDITPPEENTTAEEDDIPPSQ